MNSPLNTNPLQKYLRPLGLKLQKAPTAIGVTICRRSREPDNPNPTLIQVEEFKALSKNVGRIQLGCGPILASGYINIDNASPPEPHNEQQTASDSYYLQCEISQSLPLGSDSLEAIYSSHFIEHLDYMQANKLLFRCAEALKPGGCMRIVVPDFELWCSRYLNRSRGFFRWYTNNFLGDHWDPVQTRCTTFNGLIYGHGHRSMLDFETLRCKLLQSGFSRVRRCRWGTSSRMHNIKQLEFADNIRRHESLIVEAFK